MNWGVLIAVLIYEVVSIVGIGAFMAYKNKKNGGAESGSFAFAGGGLPASLVGITLALTLLGSAHNWEPVRMQHLWELSLHGLVSHV